MSTMRTSEMSMAQIGRRAVLFALGVALASTIMSAPRVALCQGPDAPKREGTAPSTAKKGGKAAGTAKTGASKADWGLAAAIFVVVTLLSGVGFYLGVFKMLLRKARPTRPLKAWRWCTIGVWTCACVAALAFRPPLMIQFAGLFSGMNNVFATWFVQMVILIVFVVGSLVIWNFRNDTADRSRTA